jgi:hypothetical protein
MISVKSSPEIVTLLNFGINCFSKKSCPLFFISRFLVIIPPARGMTTKRITDKMSVSQGILTPLTPAERRLWV